MGLLSIISSFVVVDPRQEERLGFYCPECGPHPARPLPPQKAEESTLKTLLHLAEHLPRIDLGQANTIILNLK